ncbi:MAG: hypothetical protein ACF787_03085 [Rhodopirellula sp. JB053]
MNRTAFLILIFALGGFATGFLLRDYSTATPAKQNDLRGEHQDDVDYVLASSVWINKLIEVARGDTEERELRFRGVLIRQVYDLARFEEYHTGNAYDVFLMHGANSLDHLGVASFEHLQQEARDSRLVESAKRPFLDASHQDYNRLTDFVSRCIAYDVKRDSRTEDAEP